MPLTEGEKKRKKTAPHWCKRIKIMLIDYPYLGKSEDLLEEHWCDKDQDVMNKLEARSKDEAGAERLHQCTQNVSLRDKKNIFSFVKTSQEKCKKIIQIEKS